MHKLIEFVCDELEELERKADKDGKLSMAEIQYADTLAHMKKNLLKSEEMMEDSEYSMAEGGSYARGGGRGGNRGGGRGGQSREGRGSYESRGSYAQRRDSRGRYSRNYSMATEDMVEELRDLMQDAPDEQTKREFEKFIRRVESM